MRQHLLFLIFICLVSTMGGLLFGYDITVISGTQEIVKEQFQLSPFWQGQYTNMAILGCLLGVFATMGLGDRFSRKTVRGRDSSVLVIVRDVSGSVYFCCPTG